ncbi:MAG: hypothetical protein NVSMB39_6850 [Candidatus Saccharimonadales bacterium]
MNQPLFSSTEPYENLLHAAETAFSEGQAKESVILAQTAVELFTEKTLGELYVRRNVEYLKAPFENLLINYNIGNNKVSKLYIALADDDIKQTDFWAAFIAHTELRNALVHEAAEATTAQARASLEAVTALIAHVQSHLQARI